MRARARVCVRVSVGGVGVCVQNAYSSARSSTTHTHTHRHAPPHTHPFPTQSKMRRDEAKRVGLKSLQDVSYFLAFACACVRLHVWCMFGAVNPGSMPVCA